MHLYSFIPYVAVLISAAFGSVAMTWHSDRRATRSMTGVFACTGVWALLELGAGLETDPGRALAWLRWVHLPALLLGPVTLQLFGQMMPNPDARVGFAIRRAYGIAIAAALFLVGSPGAIEDVVAMPWGGWMPRYGWACITIVPLGFCLPILTGWRATRVTVRDGIQSQDIPRVRGLSLVVVLSVTIAFTTEYLFPILEIPFPRLGALGIACAAALVWLGVLYLSNDLVVTPHGMARAMLAELPDGVVLVEQSGLIVSSNPRFAEMVGRPGDGLGGSKLSNWIDASFETLLMGGADRETVVLDAEGSRIPVSLSSTIARDRDGRTIGAVVVLRDLREIDSLRRRLLTSGRLAAIGELAAGIAHEVNNPVAFVRADLNMLKQRLSEIREWESGARDADLAEVLFERAERRIQHALDATDHVAQVVEDVRGFAHVGGDGLGGGDPAAMLEVAVRLARLQRGEDVRISVKTASCVERVAYGQELKQILLALLRCLAEAIEKGGAIEASIECDRRHGFLDVSIEGTPLRRSAEDLIEQVTSAAPNAVSDSHVELGLTIATELVDQLKGRLSIASRTPERVRFELAVPLEEGILP